MQTFLQSYRRYRNHARAPQTGPLPEVSCRCRSWPQAPPPSRGPSSRVGSCSRRPETPLSTQVLVFPLAIHLPQPFRTRFPPKRGNVLHFRFQSNFQYLNCAPTYKLLYSLSSQTAPKPSYFAFQKFPFLTTPLNLSSVLLVPGIFLLMSCFIGFGSLKDFLGTDPGSLHWGRRSPCRAEEKMGRSPDHPTDTSVRLAVRRQMMP